MKAADRDGKRLASGDVVRLARDVHEFTEGTLGYHEGPLCSEGVCYCDGPCAGTVEVTVESGDCIEVAPGDVVVVAEADGYDHADTLEQLERYR